MVLICSVLSMFLQLLSIQQRTFLNTGQTSSFNGSHNPPEGEKGIDETNRSDHRPRSEAKKTGEADASSNVFARWRAPDNRGKWPGS